MTIVCVGVVTENGHRQVDSLVVHVPGLLPDCILMLSFKREPGGAASVTTHNWRSGPESI